MIINSKKKWTYLRRVRQWPFSSFLTSVHTFFQEKPDPEVSRLTPVSILSPLQPFPRFWYSHWRTGCITPPPAAWFISRCHITLLQLGAVRIRRRTLTRTHCFPLLLLEVTLWNPGTTFQSRREWMKWWVAHSQMPLERKAGRRDMEIKGKSIDHVLTLEKGALSLQKTMV